MGFKKYAKNDKQLNEFIKQQIEIIKNEKNNEQKLEKLHKLFKNVFRAVVFRNTNLTKQYRDDILSDVKFGSYVLRKK